MLTRILWRSTGRTAVPCNPSQGTDYCEFHAAARSRHPGGVQVVFGDGHVTFVSDTIDWSIWQRLGAIADGQVIPAGAY